MKKFVAAQSLLAVAFLVAAAVSAVAIPTDITYSEGEASIRFKSGKQLDAEIGAVVNTGDMLRTGRDGLVELDQKGVILKISPNTVFTLMEKEQKGSTTPVLSVALGSIKFRYSKLTGKEPTVQTNGCAMGVRGTEFSVFAGADGSSLIVVDAGSVEVEAEGKLVSLAPDEGVEVKLGMGPGEKFAVHSDQVDYSKWNDEKLAAMLADPAAAMTGIEERMASYIASVTEYDVMYKEYRQRFDDLMQQKARILEEKGKEDALKFQNEAVSPVAAQASRLFLNLRYFSLAALSLRRYIGGRMYMFLKSRYMTAPDNAVWTEFVSRHNHVLASFEQSIVPQLVAEDI